MHRFHHSLDFSIGFIFIYILLSSMNELSIVIRTNYRLYQIICLLCLGLICLNLFFCWVLHLWKWIYFRVLGVRYYVVLRGFFNLGGCLGSFYVLFVIKIVYVSSLDSVDDLWEVDIFVMRGVIYFLRKEVVALFLIVIIIFVMTLIIFITI